MAVYNKQNIEHLYNLPTVDDITLADCFDIEFKRCMDYEYPDIPYTYDPKNYTGYETIRFHDPNNIVPQAELEALVVEKTKIIIEGGKARRSDMLRQERNSRLAETDWWANSDLTMTAEQTAYRQALRDITDTYTSLDDVVWPTKPE